MSAVSQGGGLHSAMVRLQVPEVCPWICFGLYLPAWARYMGCMFNALKNLFSELHGAAVEGEMFAPDDTKLAEAALMFHVISADGKILLQERDKMLEILGRHFDLSHNELSEIFEAAKKADHESVDLYRFTAALKKVMDRDQRIAVIERLWELVFADGNMHEFEDNVVWRIAQLLEVETVDRIAMKQRVRDRINGGQEN